MTFRIPAQCRTHHSDEFSLSPATFVFFLPKVVREFRKYCKSLDDHSTKFLVGRGHMLECERAAVALHELEELPSGEAECNCPEIAATILLHALAGAFEHSITLVHCDKCNADYSPRQLLKSKWKLVRGDGSGSSGARLACPRGHFIYASIEMVRD
jgi:hypothetical protein